MMVWYFQALWLMRTIQDRTNCCGSFEYWQGKFHNSHKHLLNWKLIHFCLPGNYTSRDEWFKKKCCSSREASESGPKVNYRFINLIGNDTSRSRVSWWHCDQVQSWHFEWVGLAHHPESCHHYNENRFESQ